MAPFNRGNLIPGRDTADNTNRGSVRQLPADDQLRNDQPVEPQQLPGDNQLRNDQTGDPATDYNTGETPETPIASEAPVAPATGTGSQGGSDGGGAGSGSNTDTGGSDSPPPTIQINLEGATLVKVGSGANRRYYVEWMVYGVSIRHAIGDQEAYDALGPQDWPSSITVSEPEFANRAGIDAGLADERFGITESYQRSVDEQLRIFGKEDIPAWQRNSPEVMTILMTSANEGFSAGRTLGLVAETDAFKNEHPFFAEVKGQLSGQSVSQAYSYYVNARDEIRDSWRTYRGVTADDYTLAEVMSKGWDAQEADEVLKGEAALRAMPNATAQINAILEYQGHDERVTDTNLLDLIRGVQTSQTPMEIQELINDSIRAQALQVQGIDISPMLADALGSGQSVETLNTDQVAAIAKETAQNVFRFGEELNAQREGISRDALVTAAFDGDRSADIDRLLAKFARRRAQEASGFTGSTTYQDEAGQLRVFGLSNI